MESTILIFERDTDSTSYIPIPILHTMCNIVVWIISRLLSRWNYQCLLQIPHYWCSGKYAMRGLYKYWAAWNNLRSLVNGNTCLKHWILYHAKELVVNILIKSNAKWSFLFQGIEQTNQTNRQTNTNSCNKHITLLMTISYGHVIWKSIWNMAFRY